MTQLLPADQQNITVDVKFTFSRSYSFADWLTDYAPDIQLELSDELAVRRQQLIQKFGDWCQQNTVEAVLECNPWEDGDIRTEITESAWGEQIKEVIMSNNELETQLEDLLHKYSLDEMYSDILIDGDTVYINVDGPHQTEVYITFETSADPITCIASTLKNFPADKYVINNWPNIIESYPDTNFFEYIDGVHDDVLWFNETADKMLADQLIPTS